jgi:predicted PurR-regulated permease PerM
MNTAWSKPTKYVVGVSLALLGLVALYLSRSVIPLLVVAALLAVIVRPVITWLHEGLRLPRGMAVTVTYLGLAIIVPLAFVLVVPAVVNALQYVVGLDYEGLLVRGTAWLRQTLAAIKAAPLPVDALDAYVDQLLDTLLAALQTATPTTAPEPPPVDTIIQALGSALTTTFGAAASLIGGVVSTAVLMLFIFLASVHMSLSAHTYRETCLRAMPAAYRPELTELLARIVRVWNGFFRGQLTLMLVIGVLSWLGLAALGVPGALSLGIVAGLLELIPNLGPIIATIPAVMVALLQGSSYLPISPLAVAVVVLLYYVLVQQLENSVIVPRVLGDAVELPPLVVMTGVLVGSTTAGILGALLAAPVVGTGREILRYVYRKLLGEEPFPTEAAPKQAERPSVGLRQWLHRRSQPAVKGRIAAPDASADRAPTTVPELVAPHTLPGVRPEPDDSRDR